MYSANDLAGSGDFGLYARSEQLSIAHAALGILAHELQCRRMLYCKSNIFCAATRSISGSSVVGWTVGWAVGGGYGIGCGAGWGAGCGIDRGAGCGIGCGIGWGIGWGTGWGTGWGAG